MKGAQVCVAGIPRFSAKLQLDVVPELGAKEHRGVNGLTVTVDTCSLQQSRRSISSSANSCVRAHTHTSTNMADVLVGGMVVGRPCLCNIRLEAVRTKSQGHSQAYISCSYIPLIPNLVFKLSLARP